MLGSERILPLLQLREEIFILILIVKNIIMNTWQRKKKSIRTVSKGRMFLLTLLVNKECSY